MEFEKYQHVERFGSVETNGIEFGECYVFPKIDGTNGQLWWTIEDNVGRLNAGSRNRVLSLNDDNAGFLNWCIREPQSVRFARLFRENPNVRLYGEWLIPHTLRTYDPSAWNKFYVFDVMVDENYLHYEVYKTILERYDIEYIPPICKITNPTYERLVTLLDKNTYLIQDGKGSGEGIVVKNYVYRNRFGRVTWAKLVKNEFKASHSKCQVTEIKEVRMIEQQIVDRFVSAGLVQKEFSKIDNECGWSSKLIPRLLNTVFYCLVKEETWNFVKEFKNPTIDFKRLAFLSNNKVKDIMPNLF